MKTYILKLELADRRGISIRDRDSMLLAEAEKSISREVAVPGDMTLYGLHLLIQRAFGWKNIHLHKFKLRDRDFDKLSGGCTETVLKLCGVIIRPQSEDGFEWHRHELARSGIFTEDILIEDSLYLNMIMAEGLRESFEKCRAGYGAGKRERLLTGCNRLLERLRIEEVFKEEEGNRYFDSAYEKRRLWKERMLKTAEEAAVRLETEKCRDIEGFSDMENAVRDYISCRKAYISAMSHVKSKEAKLQEPEAAVCGKKDTALMACALRDAAEAAHAFTKTFDPVIEPFFSAVEYRYDSGDEWCVNVTCSGMLETGDGIRDVPRLISTDGLNPMDDIGGTDGFFDFLRQLKDSEGEETVRLEELARLYGWKREKPEA